MEIVGSGGYGLVYFHLDQPKRVTKLYYDLEACKSLNYEAIMQRKCRQIVNSISDTSPKFLGVNIPEVYEVSNKVKKVNFSTSYNLPNNYLCGITMERVIPPIIDGFDLDEQIHIGLGLRHDCNQSWLCSNGVTRGFYANTEMMELILTEISYQNNFTLTNIAYTLGRVHRELYECSIRPFDVEIVLGVKNNQLTLNMIDFGNVTILNHSISPKDYYYDTDYKGLLRDSYVPHLSRNDKYAIDFYNGFFNSS